MPNAKLPKCHMLNPNTTNLSMHSTPRRKQFEKWQEQEQKWQAEQAEERKLIAALKQKQLREQKNSPNGAAASASAKHADGSQPDTNAFGGKNLLGNVLSPLDGTPLGEQLVAGDWVMARKSQVIKGRTDILYWFDPPFFRTGRGVKGKVNCPDITCHRQNKAQRGFVLPESHIHIMRRCSIFTATAIATTHNQRWDKYTFGFCALFFACCFTFFCFLHFRFKFAFFRCCVVFDSRNILCHSNFFFWFFFSFLRFIFQSGSKQSLSRKATPFSRAFVAITTSGELVLLYGTYADLQDAFLSSKAKAKPTPKPNRKIAIDSFLISPEWDVDASASNANANANVNANRDANGNGNSSEPGANGIVWSLLMPAAASAESLVHKPPSATKFKANANAKPKLRSVIDGVRVQPGTEFEGTMRKGSIARGGRSPKDGHFGQVMVSIRFPTVGKYVAFAKMFRTSQVSE